MKSNLIPVMNLEEMLAYFQMSSAIHFTAGSMKSYCSYVRKVDRLSKNQVVNWITEIIDNDESFDDPVQAVMDKIAPFISNLKKKEVSGFKKFVQAVIGLFYANTWLTMGDHNELFCTLIARNALFASKEVVERVKKGELGSVKNMKAAKSQEYYNPYASWDYMEHYRDNNARRKGIKKVYDPGFLNKYPGASKVKLVDSNNTANTAIKKAVLETFKQFHPNATFHSNFWKRFQDYEACHVWDYPGEREYYASICNLVLVPRALAQLTDHNEAVKKLLRFEVYKRFKFYVGNSKPKMPKKYSKYKNLWRQY